MKCLLIIEDEDTDRGGWATMPSFEGMPEEIGAKFLMNIYKEALSNLNAQPIGNKTNGIISLVCEEFIRAQHLRPFP